MAPLRQARRYPDHFSHFEHWTSPDRERPLFFCQFEAVETAVYLTEIAPKLGQGWIADYLREMNQTANSSLDRIALKMATGSGKTVVMAMSKTTKYVLRPGGGDSPFKKTPDQVVRRVCREFGNKRGIVVFNDEAHHCYRRRSLDGDEATSGTAGLTGDEKAEARVWVSGLEWVAAKLGVRAVYDLSATPFFLKGSGYPEGTLFPWVVSDFSLIDAIECGIVKVPRVPVSDGAMSSELPTYRDLWVHIREELPKKGAKTDPVSGEPHLPKQLEGALLSLYYDYKKDFEQWEKLLATSDGHARLTPPVFIVVCNNTNVSKLVFDFVSGWEKVMPDDEIRLAPGRLDLFSNVEHAPGTGEADGRRWSARPNTILVDSRQLESGEAMSADFKKIAAREIDEFKAEYRQRFPGRDADSLTDEDLLIEVMNTIGKPGRLGEQMRCVVSVSMLTEGWDVNTVTHILGVRAFGTQLLCEQVVGRGLRRTNYVPNDDGLFEPEYAEVYGVPFQFMPWPRLLAVAPSLPSPSPTSAPWRAGSPPRSPSPGSWVTATSYPPRRCARSSTTARVWHSPPSRSPRGPRRRRSSGRKSCTRWTSYVRSASRRWPSAWRAWCWNATFLRMVPAKARPDPGSSPSSCCC